MVGFVPKFQPSMTKIVGGVAFQRNKMATVLYFTDLENFWVCEEVLLVVLDWLYGVALAAFARHDGKVTEGLQVNAQW